MIAHTFFIILACVNPGHINYAEAKTRELKYLSTNNKFNRKFIDGFTIKLSEDQQELYLNILIPRTFEDDVWITLMVSLKRGKNDGYRKVFNFDVNVCDFFRKDKIIGFNILKMWTNNLLSSSTMPLICPVQKGNYSFQLYRSEKYRVHMLQVEGKYRLIGHLYLKKNNITERLINSTTLFTIRYI